MSRTVSTRIKPEMHEKLREQCNKIGCSINDYLEACIELGLTGYSDFDFGDDNKPESGSSELKSKDTLQTKTAKISYDDGKTWYDVNGNKIKNQVPKVTIEV